MISGGFKINAKISMQIVYYWAALTLGPLLLATGVSLAGIMANLFTKPTIHDIRIIEDSVWMVGKNGAIYTCDRDLSEYNKFSLTRVNLDDQMNYVLDTGLNESVMQVNTEDLINTEVTRKMLNKANFHSIFNSGKYIWIISKGGIILYSHNNGETWHIVRLLIKGPTKKFTGLKLNDISFIDQETGFIVATGGYLLRTDNGGKNWKTTEIKYSYMRRDLLSVDFNRIIFKSKKFGYVVCGRGSILITDDGGKQWVQHEIPEAVIKKHFANIFDAAFGENGETWLAGGNGLILYKKNVKGKWLIRNHGDNNIIKIISLGHGNAVAISENSQLLYTNNEGEYWQRHKMEYWKFYALARVEERVIAAGENMMTFLSVHSKEGITNWQNKFGGSNIFYSIINFFAPFVVIWIMFIFGFATLPNTKVPVFPASIGAALTGAVWVLFIFGFIFYVRVFSSGTQAIYGALAAIPLFLLMLYASSIILLYGAELTFVLQHPEIYMTEKGLESLQKEKKLFFPGIELLTIIFKNFDQGNKPIKKEGFQKLANISTNELNRLLTIFEEKQYITVNKENEWLPLKPAKFISLEDVFNAIQEVSHVIPEYDDKNEFKQFLKQHFDDYSNYRKERFEKITLEELTEKYKV